MAKTNLNYYFNKKILDMLTRFILNTNNFEIGFFEHLKKLYPDLKVPDEPSDITYSKMRENEFLETFNKPYADTLPRIIKWNGSKEDSNYILSVGEILFLNNPYYESLIIDEFSNFVYAGEETYKEECSEIISMTFSRSLNGIDNNLYAHFRKNLVDGQYQWFIKIDNVYVYDENKYCKFAKLKGYYLKEDDYIIVFKSDPNVYIIHGEENLNALGWGIN